VSRLLLLAGLSGHCEEQADEEWCDEEAVCTCASTGESTSLTSSHCDAIERVEAQMLDLSTSPALLII
jgi:hypothetical protein